jgi:uncharacterized RDD family membrane protein YckC
MNYTPWIIRVGTNTMDGLAIVPLAVAAEFIDKPGVPRLIAVVAGVVSMVLFGYNRWYLAGRTGQSWGHKAFGVRLVGDGTGRPVGVGRAALRDVAHALDVAVCYLGYLLPLVVAKRQTIADMVCRTVVVRDVLAPELAESRA